MQVVRWLVLAAVVVVGSSIQVSRTPLFDLASVPAAQVSGSAGVLPRADFLTPAELTAAERQAAEAGYQAQRPAVAAPPAPAPRRAAVPQPTGEIPLLIWNTFAPLGPDAQAWALRVAYCESRYHPDSVNSQTGAAGLFQFMPSTWAGSPYAAQSPFDPVANTNAALWLYKRSGPGRWTCK